MIVIACLLAFAGCQNHVQGPPAASPKIEIEIAEVSLADSDRPYGIFMVDVTFRNTGDGAATVIRPQDGSFWGWLSPIYELTIEKDGEPLDFLGGRCGNHGASYNRDTMVRIAPGGSATITVPVPYSPDGPGLYRVKLRYEVVSGQYPGPRYYAPSMQEFQMGEWPAGVFTGEAVSNELDLRID